MEKGERENEESGYAGAGGSGKRRGKIGRGKLGERA